MTGYDDFVDRFSHGKDFLKCVQRDMDGPAIKTIHAGGVDPRHFKNRSGDGTVPSLAEDGDVISDGHPKVSGQQPANEGDDILAPPIFGLQVAALADQVFQGGEFWLLLEWWSK